MCQICLQAARELVPISGQLDLAEQVVLAVPLVSESQLRIIDVVKSKDSVGDARQEIP
jgi:hypothetical protein